MNRCQAARVYRTLLAVPGNGEDLQWEVDLAVALGYPNGYDGNPHSIKDLILEQHPFTVIGPFVIIREIVTDEEGNGIIPPRGDRLKIRRRIRIKPRRIPSLISEKADRP